MAYTKKFRDQHDEILDKVAEIKKQLNEDTLKNDAAHMHSLLSNLLGHLETHLAVEDKLLYPQLKKSESSEVVAISIQYQQEMGGIANIVANYSKDWSSADSISNNPKQFINETNKLMSALAKRIKNENNYLYNLADDCL